MEEPILLSKGNLVVVGKNPPDKPFHAGGNAFILDPNLNTVSFVNFFGREEDCLSQRIQREKNIDTVSRQQACDKVSCPSLLSTHHTGNRMNNSTDKRDPT